MTKGDLIRTTLQETRKRREGQKPVVYQLKLQNLSRKRKETLNRAFVEAKWLYNWLVSDTERLDISAHWVEVKAGDSFEKRELIILGSQIKQGIADRLKNNLRALREMKENGQRVGFLKPKRFVNSIPLKQYGVTYTLDFARNTVQIQRLGTFRVLGLHQIPDNAEIASAVLYEKTTWLLSSCNLLR